MLATNGRPLKAKATGLVAPRSRSFWLRCAQFAGVNESMILNSFGASARTASPKLPMAGSDAPSAVWIRIPLGPFTTPPRPHAPAGLPLFVYSRDRRGCIGSLTSIAETFEIASAHPLAVGE